MSKKVNIQNLRAAGWKSQKVGVYTKGGASISLPYKGTPVVTVSISISNMDELQDILDFVEQKNKDTRVTT